MHKELVAIAFLGLLLSGYLFNVYISPEPIPCISGEGCRIAQMSAYSSFLNIPTPAYGVVFYLALGILGALWTEHTKKTILPLLCVLVASGFGVSAFLTYVEAFVIHAWCSWCLASALLVVVALYMVWKLVLEYIKPPYGTHI